MDYSSSKVKDIDVRPNSFVKHGEMDKSIDNFYLSIREDLNSDYMSLGNAMKIVSSEKVVGDSMDRNDANNICQHRVRPVREL